MAASLRMSRIRAWNREAQNLALVAPELAFIIRGFAGPGALV